MQFRIWPDVKRLSAFILNLVYGVELDGKEIQPPTPTKDLQVLFEATIQIFLKILQDPNDPQHRQISMTTPNYQALYGRIPVAPFASFANLLFEHSGWREHNSIKHYVHEDLQPLIHGVNFMWFHTKAGRNGQPSPTTALISKMFGMFFPTKHLITTGKVGAGKSTLLSILSDDPTKFTCKATPLSVTTICTKHLIKPRFLHKDFNVTLVDTPGNGNIDIINGLEEKMHQEAASSIRSDEQQMFLYVVLPTCAGGITEHDITAYRTLTRCYGAKPQSIVGVVNCDPSFHLSENEKEMFRRDLQETFAEHNIVVSAWVYVPRLDLVSVGAYMSPTVNDVRKKLWGSVCHLHAEQHRIRAERETAERLALEQKKGIEAQERQAAEQREQKRLEDVRLLEHKARMQAEANAFDAEQKRQAKVTADAIAAANAKALRLKQEAAYANAVRRATTIWIKCEENTDNPCIHTTTTTVGAIEDNGGRRPYWNCKWLGLRKHFPHVKGI